MRAQRCLAVLFRTPPKGQRYVTPAPKQRPPGVTDGAFPHTNRSSSGVVMEWMALHRPSPPPGHGVRICLEGPTPWRVRTAPRARPGSRENGSGEGTSVLSYGSPGSSPSASAHTRDGPLPKRDAAHQLRGLRGDRGRDRGDHRAGPSSAIRTPGVCRPSSEEDAAQQQDVRSACREQPRELSGLPAELIPLPRRRQCHAGAAAAVRVRLPPPPAWGSGRTPRWRGPA